MSDENKQDAAEPSPASAGSVAAWAIVCGDCVDSTFNDRDEAVEWACGIIPPPQIVPLYRSPGLTVGERAAMEQALEMATHCGRFETKAALRRLLERLT